ncbi:uncharacterized protein VICG_00944 [Vittaforma corneae ATCC 50505]|uniref:Uncharacterized protein n=1 Tax=Vittaforma corneae (strain ATCC 50505) TaxID=993615 RepID=L2GNP4_VITCO|nr:uncharacterized protein VICG_00944 [Vittaforma corneae ATCC 50505]ELA42095.1 hypothetical protein VICG_00944 [Vittaforma corneae ATCC 50505]
MLVEILGNYKIKFVLAMLLRIMIVLPFTYTAFALMAIVIVYSYSFTTNRFVWSSLSDKFVLVTYATTEFGAALCVALARKKIKMILLDTNEDRLLSLKSKLDQNICVVHRAIDIVHCSDFSFLEKYDIGLVIHQIGGSDSVPLHFIEQNIDQVLDSHLKAPLNLEKTVMISMVEKHKGYIVNIGFGHSCLPSPHHSLNSAIKCVFKSWSQSMYYEMMPFNVCVEYLEIENMVDSKSIDRSTCFTPTVETAAKWAIATLGNSYFTVPHIFQYIQYLFFNLIPKSIVARRRISKNEEVKRRKVE